MIQAGVEILEGMEGEGTRKGLACIKCQLLCPVDDNYQMGRGYYVIGTSMTKINLNEYQIVMARRVEAGGVR